MKVLEKQVQELVDLKPEKEFFVGIDSDGCVFDTMEIKHKECFCPQVINHFGLQAISKYAREAWEFVNLYSTTRGCNRFHAMLRTMSWLSQRKEVKARGIDINLLPALQDWVSRETKLGNPALKAEIERNPDPELKMVYGCSIEINETVAKIVRNIPPYPYVMESLKKISEMADSIVVSQTPYEALSREWTEHDMAGYVRLIAGQERGTKSEHLQYAAVGKYDSEKILMIGDAPGDLKAAKDNNVLYYPINPGHEEVSWERFYGEALDRFFDGTYAGSYEEKLIKEFNEYLPENPSW